MKKVLIALGVVAVLDDVGNAVEEGLQGLGNLFGN